MSSVNRGGLKHSSPSNKGSVSKSNTSLSSQGGSSKSNTPPSSYSTNSTTPLSPHDGASAGMSPGSTSVTSLSTTASDVAMESVDTPLQEQEFSDGLNKNLDRSSRKPESSKNIAAMQEGQQSQLGRDGQDSKSVLLKGDGQYCSLTLHSL